MSRQSTESLINAYIDAFNRADSAAMLALLDDDVAHDNRGAEREIGVEKFRWFLATNAAHFKEQFADCVVMSSTDGSHGAAEFTIRGTYLATTKDLPKATGQRYAVLGGIFFEIYDGKISRLTSHSNLREWLRQISQD